MGRDREEYRDRGIENQNRKHTKRQTKKSLRDIRDMINESTGESDIYEIEDHLEEGEC